MEASLAAHQSLVQLAGSSSHCLGVATAKGAPYLSLAEKKAVRSIRAKVNAAKHDWPLVSLPVAASNPEDAEEPTQTQEEVVKPAEEATVEATVGEMKDETALPAEEVKKEVDPPVEENKEEIPAAAEKVPSASQRDSMHSGGKLQPMAEEKETSETEIAAPLCSCGAGRCTLHASRAQAGRRYAKCPARRGGSNGCGFFLWVD